MGAMASQLTSRTVVYSTVYSSADQRKHQSSASLAFVRGIHRWPVNSPNKGPVTGKMFPFDDVIMKHWIDSFCSSMSECFNNFSISLLSNDTKGMVPRSKHSVTIKSIPYCICPGSLLCQSINRCSNDCIVNNNKLNIAYLLINITAFLNAKFIKDKWHIYFSKLGHLWFR